MVFVGYFLALALFDAWFTTRRMPQIGLEAELNPLIRVLARKISVPFGTYVGVLLPTLLLIPLFLHFRLFAAFMCGARTTLASFQFKVLMEQNASN